MIHDTKKPFDIHIEPASELSTTGRNLAIAISIPGLVNLWVAEKKRPAFFEIDLDGIPLEITVRVAT